MEVSTVITVIEIRALETTVTHKLSICVFPFAQKNGIVMMKKPIKGKIARILPKKYLIGMLDIESRNNAKMLYASNASYLPGGSVTQRIIKAKSEIIFAFGSLLCKGPFMCV